MTQPTLFGVQPLIIAEAISGLNRFCAQCKTDKPLDDFPKHAKKPLGRSYTCKECTKPQMKAWYAVNRLEVLARYPFDRVKHAAWREQQTEKWWDERRGKQRKHAAALKEEVLSHYSGGECKCAWCGCQEIVVLSLDHIDNSGGQKRRNGEPGGNNFYRKLKSEGFPVGYQVLCFNCNWAKGRGYSRVDGKYMAIKSAIMEDAVC